MIRDRPAETKEKPFHDRARPFQVLEGGKLALGVLVGLLISLGVFFTGELLETGITKDDSLGIMPTLLTLLVALMSVVIAHQALFEQRLMRQAGTDPVILVHLGTREDTRELATLEISNVGAGAAMNVETIFVTDISEFVPHRIITDFSSLKTPLRTIPQGSSVSYNIGVGHELLRDPEIPRIEILVRYENIDGEKTSSRQLINVKELSLQRADAPVLARISTSIEKLRKSLLKLDPEPTSHIR